MREREREMKRRVEKSREAPAEKRENLGEKLKRESVVVGKRGGHITPVLPSWRLELLISTIDRDSDSHPQHHKNNIIKLAPSFPCVSARKLAATLWELHHYNLPFTKMNQGFTVPPPRLRRIRHHSLHLLKDEDLDHLDPSPSSVDLPGSAGSFRRHFVGSFMRQHQSRNDRAIQPISPASYGSSMEVAPYNPAITPRSSVEFKGRVGDTSYSLKTSTELLKVLNRIWSLEEQHTSNMSLVKALKKELEHARSRIKELVRDQQSNRHEIDELMKQIAEDKRGRKSKEHDRINATIQSVRDELEDERKLRKRSESLHRKLARELYEVKTSLASALKELEKERESQKLLEDLCDEFAWGIRDYEQEVHALKQKYGKEWGNRDDRLIIHLSESWLDERLQMKVEAQSFSGKKHSIMEKLESDIEAFLLAKKNRNKNLVVKEPNCHRSSLESIPLNAGENDIADDDFADIDLHCFELKKASVDDLRRRGDEGEDTCVEEHSKSNIISKKVSPYEKNSGNLTSMQVTFKEQMDQSASQNENKDSINYAEEGRTGEGNPVEMSISRRSEICEVTEEDTAEKNKVDEIPGSNINSVIDNLIRNHYSSENGNGQPGNDYGIGAASYNNTAWRNQASPIRQWTRRLPSQDPTEELGSSSKLPPKLKENTLRAKLLEARTRGQRSRSRLKASKISS